MRKLMITTVSTIALTFAGAGIAAAQGDRGAAAIDHAGRPRRGRDQEARRHAERSGPAAAPDDRAARRRIGRHGPLARGRSDRRRGQLGPQVLHRRQVGGGAGDDSRWTVGEQADRADVHDPSGKEIGEVKDLAVGSDNKVKKAIIKVGGFLGIGAKTVAVDLAELKPQGQKKGFVTAMTEEELKTLPEYKQESGNWVRSYEGG